MLGPIAVICAKLKYQPRLQENPTSRLLVANRNVFMKSTVIKRSIVIAGHKTSVSLEDAFWKSLKEIASERDMSASDLVAVIDSERQHGNLSSTIRLFVLDCFVGRLSNITERHDGAHAVTTDTLPRFSLGPRGSQ